MSNRHSSSSIGYQSNSESRTSYVFWCTTFIPVRLHNIWVTVSTISSSGNRYRVRSCDTADYILPRTRTKFGERGFHYSGPAAWSTLLSDLHDITDTNVFKKWLKTGFVWSCVLTYYYCCTVCWAAPYKSLIVLVFVTENARSPNLLFVIRWQLSW